MSTRSTLPVACMIPGLLTCVAGSALATARTIAPTQSVQAVKNCALGASDCQRIQMADVICRSNADCMRFNSPGKAYLCHRSTTNKADKNKYCWLKGT